MSLLILARYWRQALFGALALALIGVALSYRSALIARGVAQERARALESTLVALRPQIAHAETVYVRDTIRAIVAVRAADSARIANRALIAAALNDSGVKVEGANLLHATNGNAKPADTAALSPAMATGNGRAETQTAPSVLRACTDQITIDSVALAAQTQALTSCEITRRLLTQERDAWKAKATTVAIQPPSHRLRTITVAGLTGALLGAVLVSLSK